MSLDYNPRPRKGLMLILVLVAVGGFAAAMGGVWLLKAPQRAAAAAAARPQGPPCASLTAEGLAAKGYKTRQSFNFQGVQIARVSGHVSCEIVDADKICQFTSPIVLVVTPAGKPASHFLTGAGQPATITVHDGVASCVLAVTFGG